MKLRHPKALLAILAVGLPATLLLADDSGPDPLCGPSPPDQVFPVQVLALSGGVIRITWPHQSDYRIDIVRGSLALLSATGGDYAQATERCLADDVDGVDFVDVFDDADLPDPGEGYWYLLRADSVSVGCHYPAASYSSSLGYFVTDMDIAIRNSGRDCTCFIDCQQP